MAENKFWTPEDLRRYLKLLRQVEDSQAERMDRIRKRIDSGYYLTDEMAQKTAQKLVAAEGACFGPLDLG